MNNSYKILAPDEIKSIYKNAYQRYRALAIDYFKTYEDEISIPYSEKFINILTNLIIFCNRFSINATEQLYNVTHLDSIQDAQTYLSHVKAYVKKINSRLKSVENRGVHLRKTHHWKFPEIFNKSQRIYVKIQPILPEKLLISDALDYFNFLGDEHFELETHEKTIPQKTANGAEQEITVNQYAIRRGNQTIKVGHFFQSLMTQTKKLISFFQSSDTKTDVKPFLNLLRLALVPDISRRLKAETTLPPGRIDKVILSYLKKSNLKSKTDLLNALQIFYNRQKELYLQLTNMQTKQIQQNNQNESIDTILFSIMPRDLSTISTFTSWHSCMSVGGLYFDDICNQIGAGAIVAYGLNSQNPDIRIARLVLKPFITEKCINMTGEQIDKGPNSDGPDFMPERVYIADQIFGLQNDRFKLISEIVAKEHFNTPDVTGAVFQAGPFHLSNLFIRYLIYDENKEDNLFDYLNHNKIAYHTHEDGTIYIPRLSLQETTQINLKNLNTDHLLIDGDLIARGGIKGPVEAYKVSIDHASNILKFPSNLSMQILKISDPKLSVLPQGISAHVLDLTATKIKEIPSFLTIDELILKGTPVKEIPFIETLKNLNISYCKNIKKISTPLKLSKLEAAYCDNLSEITDPIEVSELLDLRQSSVSKLPNHLNTKVINVYNCKNIKELEKGVHFQTLYASHSGLAKLNDDLNCRTVLANHTQIKKIPNNFSANKANFANTPIRTIPLDIQVGQLFLDNTDVKVVPANVQIEKLSLFNVPIQTIHYSKHLKSICLSKPVLYIHPNIDPKIIEGIDIKLVKQAQQNYILQYQKNKETQTLK